MTNKTISALSSASTIVGTEVLPIVQSSATVQVSVANLTSGLGTIIATKGGTGQTSYAVGDLLYADTTTTLAKLPDVATGNALISGGVSTAPSWGKIGLTTHVSGTLAVGNGGTGLTSLASGYIPYGNATSAFSSSSNFTYNGVLTVGSATGQNSVFNVVVGSGGASQGIVIVPGATGTGWLGFNNGNNASIPGQITYNFNTSVMDFYSSGTYSFSNGNVKLTTGNLIIGTSGKGIDFSAGAYGPGMTSEILNDYEEGTWTPNQGGGLTVIGAFSSSGTYTKIGRSVTIAGKVSGATSVACAAGTIITGNLPFTCNTFLATGGVLNASQTSSGIAFINPSSTNLYSVVTVAAATVIFFSATYTV